MSAGEESDIGAIVSERETQFIPRSDDDEVLWDVQEITAERGKRYKVKWVGVDPATGKPWAQSWVAKHDCTDKLVAEWKAKKALATRKKRGRRSSATRASASGPSERAASSTSGKKTSRSTPRVGSPRLNTAERRTTESSTPSPPPKTSTAKRKRRTEDLATLANGVMQTDEQSELSRPRKKQKTTLQKLLSPISSDEDELLGPSAYAKVALWEKAPQKSNGTSSDALDEEDSSPPKAKRKSVRPSDARSAGAVVGARASDLREEPALPRSKAKLRVILRHKERIRVADSDSLSAVSQDEELRLTKPQEKSTSGWESPSEPEDGLSEKEVEFVVSPIKTGPPRGVKRRQAPRESGSSSKLVPSRTKPREANSDEERVPGEASEGHIGNDVSSSPLAQRDAADSFTPIPVLHISIPQVPPSVHPHSPDLSAGARARLELFDRMMAEVSQPDADRPPPEVPAGSPPPSKSEPKNSKPCTPNGLVVPETESSGNSPGSQPLPSLQPPPARDGSPRKPIDVPTIAVITPAATPSSHSPLGFLPPGQKYLPHASRPHQPITRTIRFLPHMSPNTIRSKIHARSRTTEAPPSSIESFASPKRVNKGKQRAIEDDDRLRSNPSEGDGDGESEKNLAQKTITDSELKKRGKELFDQAQLTRETERQKKKEAKRLKAVDDIVNGTVSSPPKESPPPSIITAESNLGIRWKDAVDLNGSMDSMILDTQEHTVAKSPSKEDVQRLRVELRQEEEESTQEAMDCRPQLSVKEPEVMGGEETQMPPPRSPKTCTSNEQIEDIDMDPVEQPSTDLRYVSVVVQASQEQRHEDTDIEPSLANPPVSSPARPIPENLTDSPKRRLGEALSLLNIKSEEIQRLERELTDGRKNLQALKVELAEIQQSSEPTGPVLAAWETERAQWAQERSKWESDFSEWQMQRKEMLEERTNLSARVAELSDAALRAEETRVKLSKLEAERETWTEERAAMLRSDGLALTKVRGEYDQDRLKWEAERASWVEERARWETERAALQEKEESLTRSVDELTVKVASTTAAKVSAENDSDFFRKQYVQASGFFDSVRKENTELKKRVEIAEGQAQEGVATIKTFFEGRIQALQADVDRWKGLTELVSEKDRRTNDELRLRAAEAPELRDLCGRLNAENKSLKVDLRKLEQTRRRSAVKQKKLYCEIFSLRKERASIRSKLSQLGKIADTNSQEASCSAPGPPHLGDHESVDPHDMVTPSEPTSQLSDVSFDEPTLLFPCMWRPQWRDQCQQMFDAKEDLERHLHDHFRDLTQ